MTVRKFERESGFGVLRGFLIVARYRKVSLLIRNLNHNVIIRMNTLLKIQSSEETSDEDTNLFQNCPVVHTHAADVARRWGSAQPAGNIGISAAHIGKKGVR